MIKSRFIELMAKSISKSSTPEELAELEEFFIHFPEYRKMQAFTDALTTEEKQPDTLVKQKDINQKIDGLWDKIRTEENTITPVKEAKISSLIYWKWIAAALVVGVLTVFFFYGRKPTVPDQFAGSEMHRIYVPFGKTRDLKLSDGTKVKLNAGSTFTYPEVFSATSREVSLKGEGFFQVEKNPKRPFLVHTDKFMVKVLGTVFNVKAYATDKKVETTLLSGKILVELNDKPEKKIVMLPNEKLTVANDLEQGRNADKKAAVPEYQLERLSEANTQDVKEIAWLSNKMIFTNESFEEVGKQIERRFDVKMVFDNETLKKEEISGVFEEESLEQALSLIKMTTPFKFRRDKGVVHLSAP
ncbi:FecR family protein [Pedobacter panaciterrae]|uniref:FecR family protein n=1 Tax=Pedobacter panaciterrae TaxID=363849 RepID=UPI00155DBA29|nr:FecR domain-containing protein [Pedobacter panaciterrae]NQX52662.1 FecR family protein [Pedobacter panaciterrae]